MYKTRIRSLYPGGAIDCSGKSLSFIGNLPVEVGDEVWTDGLCIYGNEHIRGESFIPAPESEAIPVRATDFIGFVNERGRLKPVDVIDDAYILNGKKDFFHGSEEGTIDAEVAKDTDDNEIGVYTAVYDKAETTGTIQIKLNDSTVEMIDLDDYKNEDIAEAKESKTVDSENIECMQFHINSDGSWEMLVCETAVLKEELSPNGKPPEPLMIGNQTYHEYIMEKIKTYTHPTQQSEPPDTFGEIIYSKQAYLLDGSDNVEDNLNCQNSSLSNDVQVWDKLINRLIAYNIYAHDDEQSLGDYYKVVNNIDDINVLDTLPRLWMKIQRLATRQLCTNLICPLCGKTMSFDYDSDDHVYGVGPLANLEMHCDETMHYQDGTTGCGHREPFNIDLGGGGVRLRFNKFDLASSTENCRHHKFYKLKKVTSDGEIELLDDHKSVPVIDDWTFTSQQERTSERWVSNAYNYNILYTEGPYQVQFDSEGSDYSLYDCAVPQNRGAIVTIEFMAGVKSDVKKYLVYTSSPAYIYRPYEHIYLPKYYNTELADSWTWELNDGYIATVNRFKVLEIRDEEGNQICGDLPFQFNQEDIPLLSLPWDDNNLDYKDDKNIVYYANGNTEYEKTNSIGYRQYSYNSSLAVQKLKSGYLISFHNYKLYQVDNEGTITEIGDDTRNTRLNFIKKASKARR